MITEVTSRRPKGRVLSIDDDERDYRAFIRRLADRGWSVEWVENWREAEAKLKATSYDVVLIDRLWDDHKGGRRFEGDDWLKRLHARSAYPALIVVSHFPDPEALVNALRHGAYDFLEKKSDEGQEKWLDQLDKVCTRAVRWQQLKRLRHSLLRTNFEGLLKNLYVLLKDAFSDLALSVLYVEVLPGGALRARPMIPGQTELDHGESGEATLPLGKGGFLSSRLTSVGEVLRTREPLLTLRRDDMAREMFTAHAGTRLLVPVLFDEHPDDPTRTVAGILWLELAQEDALETEDARFVSDVADCLADGYSALRRREEHEQQRLTQEQHGLMAEVAHRIGNPLQTAQASLDFLRVQLRRGNPLPREELLEPVEDALGALEQAIRVGERLQQGDAGRSWHERPINLAPLVREVTDRLGSSFRAGGATLLPEVAESVPPVALDREEARYALECLIQNAREALSRRRPAPDDGASGGTARVRLSSDPSGKTVVLAVEDNGPGFQADELERAFDKFYSTKPQNYKEGKHGLGLWEAKQFAARAGGEIRAKNLPGGGAVVELLLPACSPTEPVRAGTLGDPEEVRPCC